MKSVYALFLHSTHSILYNSLYSKSYLPCEDRLAVRNECSLPAGLLGERRYDLSQGQQGLVNTHAFLGTRSNILIERNCSAINVFHKIYFFLHIITEEILSSINYQLSSDSIFTNWLWEAIITKNYGFLFKSQQHSLYIKCRDREVILG